MNFRKVTREEYRDFIRSYPRPLEFDCTGICEPPLETYNDFELAPKWPDSVVAKCSHNWLGPHREEDNSRPGKFWEYFIRTDIAAPASDSSGGD